MRTGRRDVWVYHEDSDLVVTAAGRALLKRGGSAWKKAIRDGDAVAVGLNRPGPLVVRVVLNEPLSAEEDAAWVDRWEAALKLPPGGLTLSGDAETMFSRDYPEFESHLPDVPAGDYLAEVFTLLPGENGIRTVKKASPEKLAAPAGSASEARSARGRGTSPRRTRPSIARRWPTHSPWSRNSSAARRSRSATRRKPKRCGTSPTATAGCATR